MDYHKRGFGLVELMVALLLSMVFGIAMTKLLSHTTHQSSTIKEVSDISKTSRTSLFLMTRDIANAGYMLNCVGKECGAILMAPTVVPTSDVGAVTPCYFSGTISPACQAITYTTLPISITLNYAALTASDSIQVKYSIVNSALRRVETHADNTTTTSDVANNVVQMAFLFGLDTTGAVAKGTGTVTYSPTMTDITKLRSIKIAVLIRSALPDKKYNTPATIVWLGGTYTVPVDQTHYRFKVMQQEVFLLNPTIVVES